MSERFSLHTFNICTEITNERTRQVTREGHSTDHDDTYTLGQLSRAAAFFALSASTQVDGLAPMQQLGALWPEGWARPNRKDPRRDLIRAAALCVAEIERLDRAAVIAPTK